MDWRQRIIVDPGICHGKSCFADTSVFVSIILDNLAVGVSPERIRQRYPTVTQDQIVAALAYAADSSNTCRASLLSSDVVLRSHF
ncbi:MAG: DUF433 domain-containing protein [Planctomycetota bacterium]